MPARGFILILMLGSLALLSLLVYTGQHQLLLLQHTTQIHARQQQQFSQQEAMALALIKSLPALSCYRNSDNANTVIAELLAKRGCVRGQYRFIMEDLGDFPCLLINIGGKKFATTQRRLSLLWQGDPNRATLLQLRYALQGPISTCDGEEKSLQVGVISWRYIEHIFPSPVSGEGAPKGG